MLKKETISKIAILLCSFSFLYLSYVNVASGLNSQIDNESSVGFGLSIGYVVFVLSYIVFSIGNKKRKTNLPLSLFGVYIAFLSLLGMTSLNYSIRVVGFLLWVFSYYFGNRIAMSSPPIKNYYLNTMFLSTATLVVYFLYFYYVKGFLGYQKTTDTIFFLIAYLPFIFMFDRNKALKTIFIILIIIVCFLSLKRSIILGVVVFLLAYFLLNADNKVFKKWSLWLIVILLVATGYYLYGIIGETITSRFDETMKTGGNGRAGIYSNIIRNFGASSFVELLFGHGIMSVKQINGGILAHNDFLQLLYDGGIVAVVLYISMWLHLLVLAIKNWHIRKQIGDSYSLYVSTILLLIVLSMTNCFIYSYMLLSPFMLAIGFLVGEIENKKMEIML